MTQNVVGASRGTPRRAALAPSFRPAVETLEDRVVPSFVPVTHHTAPAPPFKFAGSIASGTWSVQPSMIADVGTTQVLHGMASIPGIGAFQANGTLSLPGFVPFGHTHGTLQLTTAHGSITLQLTSVSTQLGFGGPAGKLHYTITSATGAYAGDTGSGTATFGEVPAHQVHNGAQVTTAAASFSFSFA